MNPRCFPTNSRLIALSSLALAFAGFGLVTSLKSESKSSLTPAEKCALPSEINFENLSQSKADELATRAELCVGRTVRMSCNTQPNFERE